MEHRRKGLIKPQLLRTYILDIMVCAYDMTKIKGYVLSKKTVTLSLIKTVLEIVTKQKI